jgi:PD-(D/E)XK endonuclease
METATRGNAAEAAVLCAFAQRGYSVLVPFGDGHPYDLVVELGTDLLRVQCKRAWPSRGCMLFNSRGTDHGNGRRSYRGLADIFGVYFPLTEAVYLVPIDAVPPSKGWLRIEPARNNQKRGVRFAADFEIDQWTEAKLRDLAAVRSASPELEPSIA